MSQALTPSDAANDVAHEHTNSTVRLLAQPFQVGKQKYEKRKEKEKIERLELHVVSTSALLGIDGPLLPFFF